jgi:hypothetical protein
MVWEDFLILFALRMVELMNPELLAAIINFLSQLASLFEKHPHVGGSAQKLNTIINASAAAIQGVDSVLNNPSVDTPTPPAPVAPTSPTTGEIIANASQPPKS